MMRLVMLGRSRLNVMTIIVRHGGGGGRPGGKPTFSFKERRKLGIDGKYERLKIQPFGEFEEIEKYFDPKRGDIIIDIGTGTFEEPKLDYRIDNRKKINTTLLFGSKKGFGMLEKRPKTQKFSYKRIFGHKIPKKDEK